MKNSFIIQEIRKSLLRKLIFPLLVLTASVIIFFQAPKENFFNPRPLNYKCQYENFYNPYLPNVSVSVSDLSYSGLDYMVNNQLRGHYYYTLDNGYCQFYKLNKEAGNPPAEKLSSVFLRGKLIELDEAEYESLLTDMAERLGWTVSSLKEMSSRYAVSTVSPAYFDILFYFILYVCLFLSVLDLLCSGIYILEPLRSPTFRYLGSFVEIGTLLPKVEIEVKHVCLSHAGNTFLTPNYLVNIDPLKSLILPLDSVIWIYYHSRMHRLPGMSLKLSYTLHIMALDGRTYDFHNKKKEDLIYLLDILKQRTPEILLGYSEQNKKTAKGRITARKTLLHIK